MGFSDDIGKRTGKLIDMMKRHPKYAPLVPEPGETMVAFTLRWAAHLVSPPQEPEESYDLECVDIAQAILCLRHDVNEAWCKYYALDPSYFNELSLTRTLAITAPADPAKRKFVELLGANYLLQLEREEKVQYRHQDAFKMAEQHIPERYEILFLRKDGIGDTVAYVTIEYYPATQQWCIPNIIEDEDTLFDYYNLAAMHYMKLKQAIRKENYTFCDAINLIV
ncbi:MAG: hypothetical protein ACRYG7_13090 [Janthinobacterium lividum]